MALINPYTISVPDSQIEDLHQRLSLAKFPDELDEAAWDLGAPLTDVKRLTAYWKDKYDWRKAEQNLNKLPQFTSSITVDGFSPLKIHFIHQKSKVPNAIPLLFVHGWPGSYIEVTKVLDRLTGDGSTDVPSFHVVALSLPNFGWSEGPTKRGFGLAQYAECCNKLMLKLGYEQYVTQGGDWGFYITRTISLLYPTHCKATHLNMDFGTAPSLTQYPLLAIEHLLTPYTQRTKRGLARSQWFAQEGSGYREQQSTKPQTLGYGLSDSPVFLLAWIYEKLHDWTDDYPWTEDEICTWVSIYWFSTAGPAANVRIYYEATHDPSPSSSSSSSSATSSSPSSTTIKPSLQYVPRDRLGHWINHVKIGYSHSPRELRVLPNTWTRKQGEIVFERYHDSGGHFFAWEKPEHLVADVRDMFGKESKDAGGQKRGGAFGVVEGRDGY